MDLVDVSSWSSLLVVLSAWCLRCAASLEYLYYTSTDGTIRQVRPAGLYGGLLPLKANGSSMDLQKSGYYCTFFSDGEVYDNEHKLYIKHLAYDPISKKVMMRLAEASLTVLVGPVCRPLEECQVNVTKNSKLEFLFWKAAVNYQIGAMTYYNKVLYYIVVTQKRKDSKHHEGSLELHRLDGCGDETPVSGSAAYDLSSCSHCIATLVTGVYRKFPNFRSADHIQVIRNDNGLRFLTQTQTFHYNDENVLEYLSMELLIIDEDGIVTQLHKQQVRIDFSLYVSREWVQSTCWCTHFPLPTRFVSLNFYAAAIVVLELPHLVVSKYFLFRFVESPHHTQKVNESPSLS